MFTVTIQGRVWPVDDAKLYDAIAAEVSSYPDADFIWQLLHTIAYDSDRPFDVERLGRALGLACDHEDCGPRVAAEYAKLAEETP